MFYPFGVPEIIIVVIVVLPLLCAVLAVSMFPKRAKRFGYSGTRAYLKAAPRSDEEKRDAADLALKGLACCLLGILFPPLVLAGLVPLFYGGRKFLYASMGLGLVDDPDQSHA